MKYVVQKAFSFAGDAYFAGDEFDPMKYPFLCSSKKLQALLDGRKIKEDFKLSGFEKEKMAPHKDASQKASDDEDVAQEMDDTDEEDQPIKPRRSK